MFSTITQKLNLKSIILLDMLGAFLSIIFSGLVLPRFTSVLGLDSFSLLMFFGWACGCFSFGLWAYLTSDSKARWPLRGLLALNTIYCVLSLLVIMLSSSLTMFGKGVLLTELVVVVGVIHVEISTLKRSSKDKGL